MWVPCSQCSQCSASWSSAQAGCHFANIEPVTNSVDRTRSTSSLSEKAVQTAMVENSSEGEDSDSKKCAANVCLKHFVPTNKLKRLIQLIEAENFER